MPDSKLEKPASKPSSMTLLFTDLVNSTSSIPDRGEEAEGRLFHVHHKLLTEAVRTSGGTELQWLGNGILAGFPSAADAVECAVNIQQLTRRPTENLRFEIRIGLHFGEVFHRQGNYFGTALNLTRQLSERASAGQILCSKMISELLGSRSNFSFNNVGSCEFKGLAAPMETCEVAFESGDPGAMLQRTPFVGRAIPLKRLVSRLEEATNRHGSIAMLRGEPGIGKTRLLEEFADVAVHSGALVLRGACYDGEWQAPYGPFAEAIAEYARHANPSELTAALGKHASIIARIAPALNDLLGGIPEPPPLDKEDERFRLFDAIAQFLIAVSERAPLVLILDDLHWADRGVIAMLNHVAHFAATHSLLVIGAYRDAEVNRKHPLAGALAGISRLRNFESLTLEGLSDEELASLLELIGDEDAPRALIKALSNATEGNPLFIREVLLHLIEEGKLLSDGQGWNSKLRVDELGIPEGVRQVIGRRLERLSREANQLLSVAAAFNGEFSFDVAAAAAGLDDGTALAAVDEALEAQLLRAGSHSEAFDFTHALIRQTLYAGLNPAGRVRLHRKIAEEMERTWGAQAAHHAAEVAFQFWRAAAASRTERGADYAIAAADHAAAAYAHDDVGAFLRIALELLAPNDPRRPRLLARLSFALTWSLNAEEALQTALEAAELIAASEGATAGADYYEQIARAMFTASLTRGAWTLANEGLRYIGDRRDITWASLTEIDINRAEAEDPNNPGIAIDSPRSRELCEVLKQLPREQLRARNFDPIPLSRGDILEDPAPPPRFFIMAGDFRRSLTLWHQEAADCEQRGAIARAMRAWASVSRCHNTLGDFAEARAALDRAASLSVRIAGPSFGMVSLAGARIELQVAMNDNWDQLVKDLHDDWGQPLSADGGLDNVFKGFGLESKWAAAAGHGYAACVLVHMDRPELAVRHLNMLPPALERGARWSINYVGLVCSAAETAWLMGGSEHVKIIEQSLVKNVISPDFGFYFCDSRLALARLCGLQHRYDEASQWFARARIVLDSNGARPLRAITDHDEALMYLRRKGPGDAARARSPLADALRQFRALGMTGWIRQAEIMYSALTD